ncbi:hypothetical protein A6R68_01480, partial [Neotoma lepida]
LSLREAAMTRGKRSLREAAMTCGKRSLREAAMTCGKRSLREAAMTRGISTLECPADKIYTVSCAKMKLNVSFPATGFEKHIDANDEHKLHTFYDKHVATEVAVDALGEEFCAQPPLGSLHPRLAIVTSQRSQDAEELGKQGLGR